MVIKPVISTAVRSVISSDSVQRYFTELVAAGGMYYQFSSPITLSSDFELEINGEVFDTVSSNQSFVGGSGGSSPVAGTFTMYQSSAASRTISVQLPRAGTSAAYLNLPKLPSSGFYKIVLKRVGTTVTVSSGAISNSYTHAGNITPYEISFLARWSTILYKSGVLSDLKIWTNGDRNTGTLIADSPIDEAAGVNTIANLANPANPLTRVNQPLSATELYTLNTATTPDQWENADKTKIIPIAGT